MSRKRRRFLLLVAGVAGIMVIAGIALLNPPYELPDRSQVLPDGTVLMVKAITRSSGNRLVEGNLPQRIAGRFLPDAWAQKMGAKITRVPVATRQPILWLERRWPTNALAPTGANPFGLLPPSPTAGLPGMTPAGKYRFTIKVTDSSGTRLDAPVWTFRKNAACDLMPVLLKGLPIDQPTIRLVIEPTRDTWRLSHRTFVEVPNPSFRQQRTWRASPYPITVEQDELTFRLHHFGPPETVMQRDPFFPDTDLTCEILDRAAPAHRWRVTGLRVANEAGDDGSFDLRCYRTRACHSSYFFPGTLSTNLAWKLRFELEITTPSSNELHTFRAVPLSTKTGASGAILRTRLQGLTLVVSNQLSPTRFTATLEPFEERFQLRLIEVVTPDGRTLKHRVFDRDESSLEFDLGTMKPPPATMDLVFALTRKRVIEIVAQPTASP